MFLHLLMDARSIATVTDNDFPPWLLYLHFLQHDLLRVRRFLNWGVELALTIFRGHYSVDGDGIWLLPILEAETERLSEGRLEC